MSDAIRRADLPAPHDVRRIAEVLREAGYDTWAVGGAVRDALRGGVPADWDLATAAPPAIVRRLFRRTVPIGIEHGTVGVIGKDGRMYEVTTFRRDVETFGRRARVEFAQTLDEDLDRRDFTINAVAWDPASGEVRDPYDGVGDLRRRILRTVGDPRERLREDRLRVLRALRFAGRFDLEIEGETWTAIRESAGQLGNLSAERIREELYKVLREIPRPSRALRLYERSGVLAHLYPELQGCVGFRDAPEAEDVWTHLLATVDEIASSRLRLRLAALLHDSGKPGTRQLEDGVARYPDHAGVGAALARELLGRLKASNAEIDTVTHLVAQHTGFPGRSASAADIRRWIRVVGPEHLNDLFRLRFAAYRASSEGDPQHLTALWRTARRLLMEGSALQISDLAIGGAELRSLGIPPGPLYGEILKELLDRVTDAPELNERGALMRIVQEGLGLPPSRHSGEGPE